MNSDRYVWYACYGSNLSHQRFLCYIKGGRPLYGEKTNEEGCADKRPPVEDKPYIIPHRLYFAKNKTSNWGNGGVAFLDPEDLIIEITSHISTEPVIRPKPCSKADSLAELV